MIHLAQGKWIYIHGLEAMLIIGLCFTAIGYYFGSLLWKHYQSNLSRVQNTNSKLRDKITILESHQDKLAIHIKEEQQSISATNN